MRFFRTLLEGEPIPSINAGSFPVIDEAALERLLYFLGSAQFGNRLHSLMCGLEEGRVVLDADLEEDLRVIWDDVMRMRRDCAQALGLQALAAPGSTEITMFVRDEH